MKKDRNIKLTVSERPLFKFFVSCIATSTHSGIVLLLYSCKAMSPNPFKAYLQSLLPNTKKYSSNPPFENSKLN